MKEVIMKVPSFSADYPKAPIYVAELVRCKECRHRDKHHYCVIWGQPYLCNDECFCSYGEREGE